MIYSKEPLNSVKSEKKFDEIRYKPYVPEVIELPSVTLISRTGLAFPFSFFRSGGIYKSPLVATRSALISFASIVKRGVVRVCSNDNPTAFVHSPWTVGYYHWITESIPRALTAIKYNKQMEIILPDENYYKKYEESLRLLGVDNIKYFPNGRNIISNNFILTTCPEYFGTTHPNLLNEIRSLYWAKLKIVQPCPTRLLYVSRALARGRKVLNEDEVIKTLEDYGFESVAFEDYCFSQQVKLMASTKAMISIHGAGLTNMIFMPAHGKILELVPIKNGVFDFNIVRFSTRHDPCYIRLASSLGHDYMFQECKTNVSKYKSTHMADIYVDLPTLKSSVEFLLK